MKTPTSENENENAILGLHHQQKPLVESDDDRDDRDTLSFICTLINNCLKFHPSATRLNFQFDNHHYTIFPHPPLYLGIPYFFRKTNSTQHIIIYTFVLYGI